MVRLDRIYTKSGDGGTTGLGDGSRVAKHDVRIDAYGTVDELSSVIGLALADGVPESAAELLVSIQNDLFDVGADLCVPHAEDYGKHTPLRLTEKYTSALENAIDEINEPIVPLKTFVLPGGSKAAAWFHLARTVCRRAERITCQLVELEPEKVNAEVVRYLNRLSDLLFVMSRAVNDNGKLDTLWKPGQRQG